MYINWKVRLKNKYFWVVLVAVALVVVQLILKLFGIELDLGEVGNYIKDSFNLVCSVLALFGIVIDPTTEGVSDSMLAMTYQEPKKLVFEGTDEKVDAYDNIEEFIDEVTNGKGEEDEE